MTQDLVVEPARIIAVLRRRIEELTYENAVLSAAVDQQRDEINELRGPAVQVIIPGKPAKFALRLVAHEPNGDRLGVLPHHSGFELGDPLNDVPSLKVTYPDGG
ncbi:hypothetical protein ACFQQB_51320 [Nonomuraea rubra]|uniref:hypothetical protein n=1 Tax=Nonomuraea rubra TaxID=46180 RepID=UPI00360CCB11